MVKLLSKSEPEIQKAHADILGPVAASLERPATEGKKRESNSSQPNIIPTLQQRQSMPETMRSIRRS
jgi:hypothetical protein